MKFCRRYAALLLLAAMLCTAATGCFGQTENPPEETQPTDTEPVQNEEIVPNAETPETEEYTPAQIVTEAPKEPETEVYIVIPENPQMNPGTEAPKAEEPKQEEPKAEEPIIEEPKTEEPAPADIVFEDEEDDAEAEPVTEGAVYAKGQFVSNQSPKLLLLLDWSLAKRSDGKVTMNVSASLSSYALFSNAKPDMNTFRVGEQEKKFSTAEIAYDGSTRTVTPLASETFVLEGNEEYLPVSATWQMLGTYGGVAIDNLVAEGVLDLLDLPEEWLVNP